MMLRTPALLQTKSALTRCYHHFQANQHSHIVLPPLVPARFHQKHGITHFVPNDSSNRYDVLFNSRFLTLHPAASTDGQLPGSPHTALNTNSKHLVNVRFDVGLCNPVVEVTSPSVITRVPIQIPFQDNDCTEGIQASSVVKKRRLKMNKHKHRKRRKRDRQRNK